MGGGKPLRLLGGKRLIDHAEALASQWSRIVAVAARSAAQVGHTRFPQITDDDSIEGPLAGLAASLRLAREEACDAVMTIAADMPFLPPELAGRLSREIGSHHAAIASSGSYLHPVCGLWRVATLEQLPDYLHSGRRSLKGFAEAVGFARVEWPLGSPDPFMNINSAEDLAKAEAILTA